jgi:hypothetical protein
VFLNALRVKMDVKFIIMVEVKMVVLTALVLTALVSLNGEVFLYS